MIKCLNIPNGLFCASALSIRIVKFMSVLDIFFDKFGIWAILNENKIIYTYFIKQTFNTTKHGGAEAARWAHNPEVDGSNPSCAIFIFP
jgi:hypothetical protein